MFLFNTSHKSLPYREARGRLRRGEGGKGSPRVAGAIAAVPQGHPRSFALFFEWATSMVRVVQGGKYQKIWGGSLPPRKIGNVPNK